MAAAPWVVGDSSGVMGCGTNTRADGTNGNMVSGVGTLFVIARVWMGQAEWRDASNNRLRDSRL
ncbi:hypothetical protein LBMAG56_20260 [Verrucomicrobiota bacterium]|nr:hypothetical protein LBMAG56_20260 [Verrucomicrobiota bacterium]